MNHKVPRVCPGCGAAFQSEHPELPGYLAPELLARDTAKPVVCRLCYRLTHYGEFTARPNWDDAAFRQTLQTAVSLADVAVIVIDLADFEGSWWSEIWSMLPANLPVFVVANKADLLPERVIASEIIDWISEQTIVQERRPDQVFLVSAKRCQGLDELVAAISPIANNAVIMGATNSGKSSLLRCFLPREDKTAPVVSSYPGTTLGIIPVPAGVDNLTLLDTPGLIPPGRLSDYYCEQCVPQFIASKKMSTQLSELRAGQSLLLGSVAAVTVEACSPEQATVLISYLPDGVVLHRTRRDRVPELMKSPEQWLQPPCSDCRFVDFDLWERHTIELQPNQDLAIAGLGWLSLRRSSATFTLHLPPGVRYRIRPCLIGPRN